MQRRILIVLVALLTFLSHSLHAKDIEYLSAGDAKSIITDSEISSVFISDPKIADYKVIDKYKVVLFGREVGDSVFIAFDVQGRELVNKKIIVSRNYSGIEQQVKLRFPTSAIDIYAIGTNAVVSGISLTLKGL